MGLSKKALKALNENKKIVRLICIEVDRHETTLEKWIEENDENLTRAGVLKIIREETGLTDEEILMEAETVKK